MSLVLCVELQNELRGGVGTLAFALKGPERVELSLVYIFVTRA